MRVDIWELKARMTYHDRLHKEVAEALAISPNTFTAKLQSGDFKISEIHKLMAFIPLSMEDVEKIFFVDKKKLETHQNTPAKRKSCRKTTSSSPSQRVFVTKQNRRPF